MRVSIVACGSSARDWHKLPVDLSIGVNDMYKFGHHPDWLVVVNMPHKFGSQKNNGIDRLKIIHATKPKRFLTHSVKNWNKAFPKAEYIKNLAAFHVRAKTIQKGFVYCANTSPIIAMSLGFNTGATEIVLWGVDMESHHTYRNGTSRGNKEIDLYLKFIECLERKGVKVYLGSEQSVLSKWIPVIQSH